MEVLNPLIALPRTNITARYKRLAAQEFDVRRFGSKEGGYTFEMIYGQYLSSRSACRINDRNRGLGAAVATHGIGGNMRLVMPALTIIVSVCMAHADDAAPICTPGADVLGVSRVAEVDTTRGALFGDQYPPTTLLQKGEVVLTFDDGPHPIYTKGILAALAAQCTKATFFNVGEMVKQYPDVAREVEAAGHTIGTHTWSHPNLAALPLESARKQIESAISIEDQTLHNGVAPFLRFPYLSDAKGVRDYLGGRNIAAFSIDVDSSDWRTKSPDRIVNNVLKGLHSSGGGIILFHDIHEQTVKALPTVLKELKTHGFKVVQLVPKTPIESIAVSEPTNEKVYRGAAHSRRYAHNHRKRSSAI
jgi:peptidoglycan-N-acetylglucosamine deacetylase